MSLKLIIMTGSINFIRTMSRCSVPRVSGPNAAAAGTDTRRRQATVDDEDRCNTYVRHHHVIITDQLYTLCFTRKVHPFCPHYNKVRCRPILIIFDGDVGEKICNKRFFFHYIVKHLHEYYAQ